MLSAAAYHAASMLSEMFLHSSLPSSSFPSSLLTMLHPEGSLIQQDVNIANIIVILAHIAIMTLICPCHPAESFKGEEFYLVRCHAYEVRASMRCEARSRAGLEGHYPREARGRGSERRQRGGARSRYDRGHAASGKMRRGRDTAQDAKEAAT